ncbi:HAD-IA family hydrolase [Deltaproteobacteria bacterium TL4]
MSSFRKITHVLYDMDGLLLDTEPLYTQVTQKIVERFDKRFEWSLKAKMIGKKAIDSARILVESLELPISPEEYLVERESLLAELFPSAQALPGARRLTEHLLRHHVPQAVATSSSFINYQLKITLHQEWFGGFDSIVTVDDPEVKKGKPAPDIFLAAARRLKAQPAQCLVFEDAPSGMEAALNAGMSVVVVPDPNLDKRIYERADQILNSLEEFQPELWGLPAFS